MGKGVGHESTAGQVSSRFLASVDVSPPTIRLPETLLAAFRCAGRRFSTSTGNALFRQGESPYGFFILSRGKAVMTLESERGRRSASAKL